MHSELENGFTVLVGGNLVAVKDIFEDAVFAAEKYIDATTSDENVEIYTASSPITGKKTPHPAKTWRYERASKKWKML
jgi:hypothetical protein